jgi:hypothetical protein
MDRANSGFAFPVNTIKSFVATLPTIGLSRYAKIFGRESDGTFCTISTALHFVWLGRLDSNQRMPGSKPGALPLGDGPIKLSLFNNLD